MYILSLFRYLVHHTYNSYNNSRMDEFGDEYRSMNHSERMMRKMEDFGQKKQLCDVILNAGSKRISAHRLVLSSASDYFAAMFTSNVREATQEEIHLKDVDPEALAALINYTYTGGSFQARN